MEYILFPSTLQHRRLGEVKCQLSICFSSLDLCRKKPPSHKSSHVIVLNPPIILKTLQWSHVFSCGFVHITSFCLCKDACLHFLFKPSFPCRLGYTAHWEISRLTYQGIQWWIGTDSSHLVNGLKRQDILFILRTAQGAAGTATGAQIPRGKCNSAPSCWKRSIETLEDTCLWEHSFEKQQIALYCIEPLIYLAQYCQLTANGSPWLWAEFLEIHGITWWTPIQVLTRHDSA